MFLKLGVAGGKLAVADELVKVALLKAAEVPAESRGGALTAGESLRAVNEDKGGVGKVAVVLVAGVVARACLLVCAALAANLFYRWEGVNLAGVDGSGYQTLSLGLLLLQRRGSRRSAEGITATDCQVLSAG